MQTETNQEVDVDLDKALICEARWVDRDDPTIAVPCENPATYSAIGHDEAHDTHENHQLVICDMCVALLITFGTPCDCGQVLIKNVTRL